MRVVSGTEMRNVEGGASKYVTCSYCGYKYKTSLFERLTWSNARVKMYLESTHGLPKNLNKGLAYARSSKVHK